MGGVHRRRASERRARELAAAVGDHLVHVHIELGAAARHPHMQREHVFMLSGEDFVASLNDQLVLLIAEPLAGMVCCGSGLLQGGIGGDQLTRNEVLADAEMLEGTLGLSTPQLVHRHFNHTQAIGLFTHAGHLISSGYDVRRKARRAYALSTDLPGRTKSSRTPRSPAHSSSVSPHRAAAPCLTYQLKRPLPDGTIELVLQPTEILRKLATQVPPPPSFGCLDRGGEDEVKACSARL